MIICNSCQHQNREGFLFCENCGLPLGGGGNDRISTRKLDRSDNSLSAKATWGTARLTSQSEIILHVVDAKEHILLTKQGRSLIGREDLDTNHHPDINLVPFGALEKGVSRTHAAIDRSEDTVTISDLGSSNGTYLNGQKLVSNQPRVLRDGDEIRFGKLVARVYFK